METPLHALDDLIHEGAIQAVKQCKTVWTLCSTNGSAADIKTAARSLQEIINELKTNIDTQTASFADLLLKGDTRIEKDVLTNLETCAGTLNETYVAVMSACIRTSKKEPGAEEEYGVVIREYSNILRIVIDNQANKEKVRDKTKLLLALTKKMRDGEGEFMKIAIELSTTCIDVAKLVSRRRISIPDADINARLEAECATMREKAQVFIEAGKVCQNNASEEAEDAKREAAREFAVSLQNILTLTAVTRDIATADPATVRNRISMMDKAGSRESGGSRPAARDSAKVSNLAATFGGTVASNSASTTGGGANANRASGKVAPSTAPSVGQGGGGAGAGGASSPLAPSSSSSSSSSSSTTTTTAAAAGQTTPQSAAGSGGAGAGAGAGTGAGAGAGAGNTPASSNPRVSGTGRPPVRTSGHAAPPTASVSPSPSPSPSSATSTTPSSKPGGQTLGAAQGGGGRATSRQLPPPPTEEASPASAQAQGCIAHAIHNYLSDHPDDLPFEIGSKIINIGETGDPEWLTGELKGRKGIFPRNHVELKGTPTPLPSSAPAVAPTTSSSSKPTTATAKGAAGAGAGAKGPPISVPAPTPVEEPVDEWVYAKALYKFKGSDPSELTFKVGDIIENILIVDDLWYSGELDGMEGVFPQNHVQLLSPDEVEDLKASGVISQRRANTGNTDSNLPVEEEDEVGDGAVAKAIFPFVGKGSDELSFKKGDLVYNILVCDASGEWFSGHLLSAPKVTGMFPSNHVELLSDVEEASAKAMARAKVAAAKAAIKGALCRAIYDFEGEDLTELTFKAGDLIKDVLVMDDVGEWYAGELGGVRAMFPSSYVEVVDEEEEKRKAAAALAVRVRKVKALYDFKAVNLDELGFKAGEIITKVETLNAEWLYGETATGKAGMFPMAFVEEIPDGIPFYLQKLMK